MYAADDDNGSQPLYQFYCVLLKVAMLPLLADQMIVLQHQSLATTLLTHLVMDATR